MKLPPYGRNVVAAPPGYWDRGTRVVIFAGPEAWAWARAFLEPDPDTILRARQRYTLVLPPEALEHAGVYRWPVEGRAVLVIDTGAGEQALQPLISALQRDACAGGEILDVASMPPWAAELHLSVTLQPWVHATFDAEIVEQHNRMLQDLEIELSGLILRRFRETWAIDARDAEYLRSGPPGSVRAIALEKIRDAQRVIDAIQAVPA